MWDRSRHFSADESHHWTPILLGKGPHSRRRIGCCGGPGYCQRHDQKERYYRLNVLAVRPDPIVSPSTRISGHSGQTGTVRDSQPQFLVPFTVTKPVTNQENSRKICSHDTKLPKAGNCGPVMREDLAVKSQESTCVTIYLALRSSVREVEFLL